MQCDPRQPDNVRSRRQVAESMSCRRSGTKFQQNSDNPRMIRQIFADRFSGSFFSEFSWPNYVKFGEKNRVQSSGLPTRILQFRYVAAVRFETRTSRDLRWKSPPTFSHCQPCTIYGRDGRNVCVNLSCESSASTTDVLLMGRRSAVCLGDERFARKKCSTTK